MTERLFNLVVPLAESPATAMRTTETNAHASAERSGAVSLPIGTSLRPGDVDSTNHSTPPTVRMPGCRTSTTATRTTTTRTTSTGRVPSADKSGPRAEFSFSELVQAYLDCRQHKRNTSSALAFEQNQERNLIELRDELLSGQYRPGKSICFIITRPKPREVWAADFRDRIVHHLLYNRISARFYASFIADSCACIPGRGTLYGAQRLETKIRSITQNWSQPAHYLKCDLANFFVSIDKAILWEMIAAKVPEPFWRELTHTILFHDPRRHFEWRGDRNKIELVPPHKRLTNQRAGYGLPIGNLSSQFFANIYLNALDQFIKHKIGCRHYIRYVDDFILLHRDPHWLNAALKGINAFVRERLNVRLNTSKTILQPVDRGVDFVGSVIRPWSRRTRKRTKNEALHRIACLPADRVWQTANSYFGLLRQSPSSHSDRAALANAVRRRGNSVDMNLTKTYQKRT